MVAVRRFVLLQGECVAGPAEVVLEVPLSAIAGLTLELALLLARMSTSLRLRPNAGPAVVLVMLNADNVSKALVTREADGSLRFALGINQGEYIQAVLLRAYRDQMAEVNHVHIEGDLAGAPFDLTITFDSFREPMSSEEAATRLAD